MHMSPEAQEWLKSFFNLWSDHTKRVADHYNAFAALPPTVKHEVEAVTAEEPITAFAVCAAPSILLTELGFQHKWDSAVIVGIGESSTRHRSSYNCTQNATPSAILGCLSVLVDALFKSQDEEVAQLVGCEIITQIATDVGAISARRMQLMEDFQKAQQRVMTKIAEGEKEPAN